MPQPTRRYLAYTTMPGWKFFVVTVAKRANVADEHTAVWHVVADTMDIGRLTVAERYHLRPMSDIQEMREKR